MDMVLLALQKMRGGELFVKKIPSMRIVDLAHAIAPNIPLKEVGIRPGEKIHEQMITVEDARNTVDAGDFFVVLPYGAPHSEYGKQVPDGFEYSSGMNTQWLSIEDMQNLIRDMD